MRAAVARRWITTALAGLVVLVGGGWLVQQGLSDGPPPQPPAAVAPGNEAPGNSPATDGAVPLSSLPLEAGQTWALIQAGGPFPSDRDGSTFGNREGLLPDREMGYYREYTVPTPGESDRGARRLVTGNGGELYYTADHYASFVLVDPKR